MLRCLATLLTVLVLPAAAAAATTREAARWRPHGWWLAQAWCIHGHESADWHRAGRDWRGNRSPYFGGMQFLVSTWRSVGGTGVPSDWSPREQLYRAYRVWLRDGGSWREWGSARACGLR